MANKRQKKGVKKTNLDGEICLLNDRLNDLSCENAKNVRINHSNNGNENEKGRSNANVKTAKKINGNNNTRPNTRAKRWNDSDVKKLKVIIKVVDPKTEEHWKMVAEAVGCKSETECKEKAEKLDLLRADAQFLDNDDKEKIYNAEDEWQPDDFFNRLNDEDYLLNLDADDSLLYIMLTPEQKVRFPRKPFMVKQLTEESTACIDVLDLDISI